MTNKKYIPPALTTIAVIIYILMNPVETAYYCSYAVKLCINSLIPSLFIFMVLSRILSALTAKGVFDCRFTEAVSRLLHLPVCLIPVCIFGLFSGAPSGAFAISDLYKKGLCSKAEAERACVLSNNCSAAFILGFAGSFFDSRYTSFCILISNILASVTVYLLLFNSRDITKHGIYRTDCSEGIFSLVTRSISDAASAVTGLCGYVLFFSTLSGILSHKAGLISSFLNLTPSAVLTVKTAVSGFMEITSGIMNASEISGNAATVLTASVCAFCGLSVIMQVNGILTKCGLSVKPYLLSRFLCSMLCPIYTLILLFISPSYITVSKTTVSARHGITGSDVIFLSLIIVIWAVGGFLLAYLDKKHKN